MLTGMTARDWTIVLAVFDAAQSKRGEPGHDDRKFLEAMHAFTVHNIRWRALPSEFDSFANRAAARARGITPIIPRRENSKQRRRFFSKAPV